MPVRPTLELSAPDAAAMLEGLVAVNVQQMARAGPVRPRVRDLIQRRVLRYSRDDPDEHWQPYDTLLDKIRRDGVAFGDCEDLGSALAAEMRDPTDLFHDPLARTFVYRTGPRMSHVVVQSPRWGQGPHKLIDPSKAAGMGWDEPPARLSGSPLAVDLRSVLLGWP